MQAPPSGPPSPTLFVTGLPIDCTAEFAKSIFGQYGIVKDARMLPVAPGKTAAAAVVVMNTADDAKWIVEHVNGNVPQSLTTPVTVTFKFKGKGFEKGFGKGLDAGALGALGAGLANLGGMGGMGAAMGGCGEKGGDDAGKGMNGGSANPAAVAGLLQLLAPLVGALSGGAGGGKGATWPAPKPPPGQQICRYFEAGTPCPRNGCTFWHGDSSDVAKGTGPGMISMSSGAPGTIYKTRKCDFFAQGKCTWGENCRFAHFEHELVQA